MNTVNFGPYLSICDLYEPDFSEKIREKVYSFQLSSTSDGSLAEESILEDLEIDFPMTIDSQEFGEFKEASIAAFNQKYIKLIKFLEKNNVVFGINYGFYFIPS